MRQARGWLSADRSTDVFGCVELVFWCFLEFDSPEVLPMVEEHEVEHSTKVQAAIQ